MRRLLSFFTMALMTLVAMAAEVTDNGITYYLQDANLTASALAYDKYTLSGDVVIKDKVTSGGKTYTVTGIQDYGFDGCNNITSVQLPNTLTEFGQAAFRNCSNLKSINIPSGVKVITSGAFQYCGSFETFTIPNTVTTIESDAFGTNSGLKTLTIGSGVTSIETTAFKGCSSLEQVIFLGTTPPAMAEDAFQNANSYWCKYLVPESAYEAYKAKEPFSNFSYLLGNDGSVEATIDMGGWGVNIYVLIDESTHTAKIARQYGHAGGDLPIGKTVEYNNVSYTVTGIVDKAFEGCGITSVQIPSTVTSVGSRAFANCSQLEAVHSFNTNVPTTASDAFDGTDLSNSVLYVDKNSKSKYQSANPWSKFFKIKSKEDGVLVNGIYYILYDSNLTAEVTHGEKKYQDMVNILKNVTYGGKTYKVTKIGDEAFKDCPQLMDVSFEWDAEIESIGARAFAGCSSLNRAPFFMSLKTVGADAFDGCTSLETIHLNGMTTEEILPELNHRLSIVYATAKSNPLYYAHKLAHWGMDGETFITEIPFPDSSTEIKSYVLAGASDVTSVSIPSSVTKIGEGAFYGCSSLKISELPSGINAIAASTFEGCTSITKFTIHEGIKNVGSRAFAGCTGLKDMECYTSYVPTAQANTFADANLTNSTLYVNNSLLEQFKTADGWKDFGNFDGKVSEEEKAELLATDFLAMTATDGDVEIYMNNGKEAIYLQTSFDKLTWSEPIKVDGKDGVPLVTIPSGKTAYFRRSGSVDTSMHKWRFYTYGEGKIELSGNIMSLLDTKCQSTELSEEAFYCLFSGCQQLTDASRLILPATKLQTSCYERMFAECRGLTSAPKLPVTTLADKCYYYMFKECINLTTAPELPATTLAEQCYTGMFWECWKLTTVPELPATEMKDGCYSSMFRNCTSLMKAPELPATKLAKECYVVMFSGCKALTTTPKLPATTLAYRCYSLMFQNCTNLTNVQELPATTLTEICYEGMFQGCPELNTITIKLEDYADGTMVKDCLKNTKSPFTLTCPQTLIDKKGIAQIKKDFNLRDEDIVEAYLTEEEKAELLATDFLAVTAVSNDVDLISSHSSWEVLDAPSLKTVCLQASTDKLTWDAPIKLEEDKIYEIAKIAKGTKLYIRRYGDVDDSMQGWTLKSKSNESTMALSGNVMSLLDKECKSTKVGENAFFFLFGSTYRIGQVVSASELKLPALELSKYCYSGMFYGNSLLEDTPELPATTLAEYCYSNMFGDCSKLSSAPKLPALKLSEGCYNMMFFACYKFEEAPELPATTLAEYCYNMMFAYTHLTEAPELPATTLAEGCYNRMFSYCESLTKAPELPATTLTTSCYRLMFSGCRRLTTAPELPATELADTCYNNMFSKCTSLVNVPLIAATSLKDFSMGRMFSDCSKLNNLTVRFDDYDNGDGKYYVSNCLASTKYPFTLYCPQVLIDKKGMDQIKKDFGLRLDDNIVALEVIESAILDDENHTAWLRHGTRGGKRNNGDDDPDSPGYRGHRLTFPGKITVDGDDYEVVGISPEAFEDLDGITEIVIDLPRVPDMAPDAFDNIDLSHITLYVPEELLDDYRNTLPWSRFPEIRPIHEHVTTPDGSEFLIDHGTNTAEMLSGGRHEDTPHAIIIPEYVEVDGVRYPITSVSPDVFADLTGIEEIYVLTPYVPYLDPHALDGLDLSHIVLYVPESLIDSYSQTEPWSRFPDIRPIEATAIQTPSLTDADRTGRTITGYYDLNGAAISSPRRGVNIIRYSDGSTRKVMVK